LGFGILFYFLKMTLVPWQALTLIILFQKYWFIFPLSIIFWRKVWSLQDYFIWKIQKLINYSTDVCPFFLIFERQIGVPPPPPNFEILGPTKRVPITSQIPFSPYYGTFEWSSTQ
jgi:hypothetical protein